MQTLNDGLKPTSNGLLPYNMVFSIDTKKSKKSNKWILVPSSFLLLVVRPGAPSSVLAPSSKGYPLRGHRAE